MLLIFTELKGNSDSVVSYTQQLEGGGVKVEEMRVKIFKILV